MAFNLFTLKIHFKLKDCFAPKMKKTVIHSKLFIVFISFCVELRHFKSVKNDNKNTRYDKRINKMMSTERHLSFLRNEFTSCLLARSLSLIFFVVFIWRKIYLHFLKIFPIHSIVGTICVVHSGCKQKACVAFIIISLIYFHAYCFNIFTACDASKSS